MNLLDTINLDLIKASKNNQAKVRDTLRLVKTTIKNLEIKLGHALTDQEIIECLAKEIKQRQEAISSFYAGNRPDLAVNEETEINIIYQYLPVQLSESEINTLIDEAIMLTHANTVNDMGKVMNQIKPKITGKADMSQVSQLVKTKLN